MRSLCMFIGAALLFACARAAVAQTDQETLKVIVLVDSGEDALSQRLRQEMESLGLEVEVAAASSNEVASLEREARRVGAIAAVRVSGTVAGSVDMTIIDRATGKTVHRRLVIATPADPAASELIAVRTIELLRASLMELRSSHPARGEVPITAKVEALAEQPSPRIKPVPATVAPAVSRPSEGKVVTLSAGPALILAKGWSGGFGLGFSSVVNWPGGLGAEIAATLPVRAMERSGFAGSATLDPSVFQLGIRYANWQRRTAFSVSVGVDAAKLAFGAAAVEPYIAVRSNHVTYGGYATLGVGLRLYRSLGIRLEQTVLYQMRNTVVRFAGVESGSIGQPIGLTALALELRWP